MGAIFDKLKDYGADVDGALERFIDDKEFYEECVQMFMDEPGFAALGEAIEGKDYKEAFNHAHTLKGVAGNLGLTPMLNDICTIVEALRAEDYSNLADQYADVTTALDTVKGLVAQSAEPKKE
ncbi:MAG: Hpt domain-containing protein [Hespellia sp.]|nr:Hpt domain-containing protein [Hespellia sp.]